MNTKKILSIFLFSMLFLVTVLSAMQLSRLARLVQQKRYWKKKNLTERTRRVTFKRYDSQYFRAITKRLTRLNQSYQPLYAIIQNVLWRRVQDIKQYFYPQQKNSLQIPEGMTGFPDYRIETLTVNLLLPQEKREISIAKQLKEHEGQLKNKINIIFVTPKYKPVLYELKNLDAATPVQRGQMVISQIRNILSDKTRLDSILKQKKGDPETAETITIILDLDKARDKTITKLKSSLKKYAKNNNWKRLNMIFVKDKKTTLFQVARQKNTTSIEQGANQFALFLKTNYQPLINSVRKIQEEAFFVLEQLSIQKALTEVFEKKDT